MGRLSPDQIEQIAVYAEQGKGGGFISRALGLKRSGVDHQMLLAGYDPWPSKRNGDFRRRGSFSAEEEATILRLAMTKSVHAIAKEMKRSYSSIRVKLMTLEVRAGDRP